MSLHFTRYWLTFSPSYVQLANGIRPRAPVGIVSKFLSSFAMIEFLHMFIYCNYNKFLKNTTKDYSKDILLLQFLFNADIVAEDQHDLIIAD